MKDCHKTLDKDGRKQLVEDLKTRHGGFTAAALQEIGIAWPPTRGWRKRFVDGVTLDRAGGQAPSKTRSKRAERKARKRDARKKRKLKAIQKDDFLESYEWRRLRYSAILLHGRKCMACGRTPDDGITIHVDHIKPRRKYPELALVLLNLQVLCHECNHGKGNWDETDWRPAVS